MRSGMKGHISCLASGKQQSEIRYAGFLQKTNVALKRYTSVKLNTSLARSPLN